MWEKLLQVDEYMLYVSCSLSVDIYSVCIKQYGIKNVYFHERVGRTPTYLEMCSVGKSPTRHIRALAKLLSGKSVR